MTDLQRIPLFEDSRLGYELRGTLIGFTLRAERVVTKQLSTQSDCKPVVLHAPRKAPKRLLDPLIPMNGAWATPRSEDSARAVAAFKKGFPIMAVTKLETFARS